MDFVPPPACQGGSSSSFSRLREELPARAGSGAGRRAAIGPERPRDRAKPAADRRERSGSVQSVSTFSEPGIGHTSSRGSLVYGPAPVVEVAGGRIVPDAPVAQELLVEARFVNDGAEYAAQPWGHFLIGLGPTKQCQTPVRLRLVLLNAKGLAFGKMRKRMGSIRPL